MNKINNWEHIKEKSLWVNANFDGADQINDSEHIYFSFMTSSLNNLLSFSINLINDSNKAIEFNRSENFQIIISEKDKHLYDLKVFY